MEELLVRVKIFSNLKKKNGRLDIKFSTLFFWCVEVFRRCNIFLSNYYQSENSLTLYRSFEIWSFWYVRLLIEHRIYINVSMRVKVFILQKSEAEDIISVSFMHINAFNFCGYDAMTYWLSIRLCYENISGVRRGKNEVSLY